MEKTCETCGERNLVRVKRVAFKYNETESNETKSNKTELNKKDWFRSMKICVISAHLMPNSFYLVSYAMTPRQSTFLKIVKSSKLMDDERTLPHAVNVQNFDHFKGVEIPVISERKSTHILIEQTTTRYLQFWKNVKAFTLTTLTMFFLDWILLPVKDLLVWDRNPFKLRRFNQQVSVVMSVNAINLNTKFPN